MDPTYNNSFGSAGDGGIPQQPIISSGDMGVSGNAPQPIISSGTGDIILQSSVKSGNSKKRWLIIAGVFLLVVAVVLGVVAVVIGNNKKSLPEVYGDVFSSTSGYSIKIKEINNFLKRGIDKKISVGEFFTDGFDQIVGYYREILNDFGSKIKNINYDDLPGDYKNKVSNFVRVTAPEYVSATNDVFDNIIAVNESFLNNDYDSLEGILIDVGVSDDVRNRIMGYAKEREDVRLSAESCSKEADFATCEESDKIIDYTERINDDFNTTSSIFAVFVNESFFSMTERVILDLNEIRMIAEFER